MNKNPNRMTATEAAKELGCTGVMVKYLIEAKIAPVGVVIKGDDGKHDSIYISRPSFESWRDGRTLAEIKAREEKDRIKPLDKIYLQNMSLKELIAILEDNNNFKLMIAAINEVLKDGREIA